MVNGFDFNGIKVSPGSPPSSALLFFLRLRRGLNILRSHDQEWQPGSMEHTSSYTAHSPLLHTAASMGRYGDEIKHILFGFLHNGFSYVWIGFNGADDREIKVCQITFTKVIYQASQVLLIFVFHVLVQARINMWIALKFSSASRKVHY